MDEISVIRKSRTTTVDIPSLIGELRRKGITKYKIAQTVQVTWQTVHAWERGFYVPSETHEAELLKLR